MPTDRLNHWAIAVLGIVTIVAYGTWYYSFGVLFDPIRIDTGWSEATLALSFSLGAVAMGLASLWGGRLLDRFGTRTVLAVGGVGGGGALLVTSYTTSVWVFIVASGAAMVFLGAFGFYHNTMTAAVRLNPRSPAKAISVLTVWGAFASAVYLPGSAALVNRYEWRITVRILAAIVVVVLVGAAMLLPMPTDQPKATKDQHRPSLRSIVVSSVATAERRAFTAAVALGGVAMSTVLVYQVPAMTAAGLPLTTAATMAGIRGFAQTGGRVPLSPIVDRIGSSRALVMAFTALTVGGVLLAVSGTILIALAFAMVTGFGIGAFSPLQGITAEELYDRESLGATMGLYSTFLSVAGASGPAIAGVLADATGDRRVVSVVIVLAALGATISALRLTRSRSAVLAA